MRFGLMYEQQLPRPWSEGAEAKLFHNALGQVELADRLGYDYCWANEHHFLEEYAHSSAPEVFLAAASRNTRHIRLGHAVVLTLPGYNHPARVAERIATLDIVSNGRVEFGTGESASAAELEGFNIPPERKRDMWLEGAEQCADMLAMDPYPGFEGKYFSMPCRNVVPKPMQKPHPPMWLACSNRDSILRAARLGLGALTFAFVDYPEAKKWVDEYYHLIRTECVPLGHSVNANIAIVSPFSIHHDRDEAARRGLDAFRFFGFASGHHYVFGEHTPGRTDIWKRFQEVLPSMPSEAATRGIGTPSEIRDHVRALKQLGVDQVIFIQQSGRLEDAHIREGLELFAREVMSEFKATAEEEERRKAEELAPYIAAALARKTRRPPLGDDEIPTIKALGRRFAEAAGTIRSEQEEMQNAVQSLLEKTGASERYIRESNVLSQHQTSGST